MAVPVTSFDGISNLDQGDIGLPPDSDGAVGPNHFVQWIQYRDRDLLKDRRPIGRTDPRQRPSGSQLGFPIRAVPRMTAIQWCFMTVPPIAGS